MQRNHNFTTATQLNRSVCLQTPCTDAVETGAFTTVVQTLKEAATSVLRYFNTKPVIAASAQEVCLGAHQLWSARLAEYTIISCRTGVLWITRSSDSKDYMLQAGQAMVVARGTKVVISTFSKAAAISIMQA